MRSILIFALISCCVVLTPNQSLAQERRINRPASVAAETSDRELDGLTGPVRRVKVEIAKITVKDGNFTEGPRVLRETSTYDPKGKKIDTVAHPVEGSSLPGKEEYRYDDNGNIVEMILRGEDGSILSKETYTYELDEIGNWKKMTSSVAIYEDGKLAYEPVEVTYRTISYYFGQAVDKLVAASKKPESASLKSNEAAPLKNREAAPPKISETRAPKTSQAANTSSEQISVPTGSTVSGPTRSLTQPTIKPIETSEKVVTTRDIAPSENLNAQPTKPADAPVEKQVTTAESTTVANSASQPVPSSSQLTSDKAEDKKVDVPSDTAASNPEVKETGSNPRPAASEKTAEAPAEKAHTTNSVTETHKTATSSSVVETRKASTPSEVVENTKPSSEMTTAPTRTASSTTVGASTPTNPAAAAYEQGLSHLGALRFPEAIKSLTESARLNPNDAQTYLKLGVAYSSQGQYKEALAVLKMALQIKREVVDAQGFYHLGTAYANVGKHSEALDAFKQTLYIMRADTVDPQTTGKNAPPLAHVHQGLGAMYYNLRRPNDAIKELKRAVELNPKLADAYYVLALSYVAVGNRKSAETQRNTLKTLNATLASKLDKVLSSHDSGVHCRSVFGGCQ